MRARWAKGWLVVAALGCGDDGARGDDGADRAWGACDGAGVRCVATGVADGSWLTADWADEPRRGERALPEALDSPSTPGRCVADEGTIGEFRCEGLRPGAEAGVRVRARVRMRTTDGRVDGEHDCPTDWRVSLRVRVDGSDDRTLDSAVVDGFNDPGCRRGPDLAEDVRAFADAVGRLRVRVALARCDRPGAGSCVFLRGTGVEVVQ